MILAMTGGYVPNRIIRDSCKTSPSLAALSDLAERTWWRIVATLDDFGRYHGSDMALLAAAYPAAPAGLTPRRFAAALAELEAGDLLRRYESNGRTYIYSPTWPKYQRLRAIRSQFPEPPCFLGRGHRAVNPPPSAPGDGVGIGDGIGVGGTHCAPKPRAVREAQFAEFWKAYPLHKAPDRAERAFRAALKRGATLEEMLAAVRRQLAERADLDRAGEFVPRWPYPATWLNGGSWRDEAKPAEPAPTDTQGQTDHAEGRARWVALMAEMRSRNPAAYEHTVRDMTPTDRGKLDQEIDNLAAQAAEEGRHS